MPALREVQEGFAQVVLGTGTICGFVQGRVPAEVATAIYRNNVRGNAVNALQAAFPALQELLGGGCFEAMAQRYLERFPSRSGDLHDLGADLAGYLKTVPEFEGLAYLPDVARLEWLQGRALIAADAQDFDFSGLASISADSLGELRFRLAPAVRRLRSPWPVFSIWKLARSAAAGEQGPDVDLEQGGEQVLVYRHGCGAVLTEAISPGAAQLLRALGDGVSFAEACELAWAVEPEAEVGVWLSGFVAKGVICAWYR